MKAYQSLNNLFNSVFAETFINGLQPASKEHHKDWRFNQQDTKLKGKTEEKTQWEITCESHLSYLDTQDHHIEQVMTLQQKHHLCSIYQCVPQP